jgi:hypothetical protein
MKRIEGFGSKSITRLQNGNVSVPNKKERSQRQRL